MMDDLVDLCPFGEYLDFLPGYDLHDVFIIQPGESHVEIVVFARGSLVRYILNRNLHTLIFQPTRILFGITSTLLVDSDASDVC